MSRKSVKTSRKVDRRVKRTRDLLGDALVVLMQEKPWPEITVQHVLDRAKVSRSTFYTHYRDKNDLFMSDAEDFFEMMAGLLSRSKEKSQRVLPVREFCAHISDAREFISALHDAGKMHDIWELGRGHFARAIEERLSQLDPTGRVPSAAQSARAYMLAGALISLLDWWMDRGMKESPEEVDSLYHEIVWPGIGKTAAQPAKAFTLPFPRKLEGNGRGKSTTSIRHA
jgi:AcrR family transcriptional regulator